MSNFNGYFRDKGAKDLVANYLNAPDIYSSKKISSMTFHIVEEDPQPASYYIENKLTAVWTVQVDYTIGDDPKVLSSTFEVPKEIDGTFIIEGSYRIATNKLEPDWNCRIKMSGRGEHEIQFDYARRYDINKKILKLKRDEEGNYLMRAVEVPYDKIDDYPKREMLRLSPEQGKKFAIKLDLDYTPEFITTKLINECIDYGDDKLKDLIIDKTIESVPVGFMNYMLHGGARGSNLTNARRAIANYYRKEGKIQEELNPISTLAFRFFKGTPEAKAGEANLQVPPGVNAINLESIGQKIVIPKTIAYNASMADLIDFADTPINQNTNVQNSLTVSTHISDTDGVLFDVYDKDFNKITIKYIDYLDHKVCASAYVDYNTKTLKPNAEGQVEVKHRMRRKMVDVEEVELIDLHPDYRLSEVSRRIPFINFTDSVRISMGTSMLKQSIPLANAQRPLVDTGRAEELHTNTLNDRFDYDEGKVTKIDEDNVYIKLTSGEEVKTPRRTAIQSINDVDVFSEPKVKVGQIVKKGDIITGPVGLSDSTYKPGLNTLVLFSAHFGLINEDALVVSESYAERMKHYSIVDLVYKIKTNQCIKWLPPIGLRVKYIDPITSVYSVTRLDEVNKALTEKLGGLFGEPGQNLTEFTQELVYKVPNNIDEAWVSDVIVQKQEKPIIPKSVKKPDYTFSHESDKVIEEYMNEKNRKIIYDKFQEYIASDTLDPVDMDPYDFKTTYIVRIRLIKKTTLMVGSKVTNRYGGKGVISTVVPDELMPIMVEKNGRQHRVEVVMNPYSTINRKIAGVLLEQSLGNIIHKIYDLVEEYKGTASGRKKIMPMIKKYYPGRYDNLSVEEFIKLHESNPIEEVYYINVGCFSDFTPARVQEWMDELGVDSQYDILMPESELADLEELKANLDPDEYEEIVKGMKGKMRKVEKPLQCGWMTLEELYHIPSYSNKVTTSMYYQGVDPNRDEPAMGRGRYRETGQKIEEMSLSVLLSRNAKSYIEAARGDRAKEDNQTFLNQLLGMGLTVVDQESGYRQGGSSVKAEIEARKNKFRLKALGKTK